MIYLQIFHEPMSHQGRGSSCGRSSACGVWGARLMFTTESARECVEVARSYLGLSDYRPNVLTRGLYYRGVD